MQKCHKSGAKKMQDVLTILYNKYKINLGDVMWKENFIKF